MMSACFRMNEPNGLPFSVTDFTYLFSFEKFFATMVNVFGETLARAPAVALERYPPALNSSLFTLNSTFGTCGAPMT